MTRIARLAGAYALAAALLTLTGWAFEIRRLTSWDGGASQMPNNAIAVAASGAALILWSLGRTRASTILGAFVAAIAGATLFEHLTGISLGIDTLILHREWGQKGVVAPGRMGVPSSSALFIIGLSIILRRRFAVTGGLFTIVIALLSLIGFVFRADPFYAIPRLTAIALQTSTMLFALGIGLMALVPERPPVSLMTGNSGAALLVRRTLPAIVLLPLLLGWLRMRGQEAGLFDTAFGTAALVLTLIILFASLLWWSAAAIAAHESAMQTSEQKFERLFRKAAFGAALARLPDGLFIDINEAFEQMFGFTRDEVIGKSSVELGINRQPSIRSDLIEELRKGGVIRNQEITLHTRSGEARTFLNNVTVVEIGGQPHLLSTIQDITERQAAAESLRRSAEALRTADRMKDEFLATLSHELRTPLTAIIGWSHLLLNADLEKQEQHVALEAIRSSAKAQSQLTEDILDVSRITTGKLRLRREHADVVKVIEAAVATVRPAAEAKRIPIRLTLDTSVPALFIDPDRIQQVVWNLLSNAIKFSPAGTPVEVRLHAEGELAVIDVIDHGPGIVRSFLPYVFERFRQADSSSSRAYAGMGIGLALAKDLVELHGGSIEVESEEGSGSHFTVRLHVPSEGAAAMDRRRGSSGAILEDVRIVYVDDREDARLLIGTMLRQHGAEVTVSGSVEDALVRVAGEKPDVVITDLAMPGRDGYELLASIRSEPRFRALPVIALTAQGRVEDEARAMEAGFEAFLRKPIESDDLAAAVDRAILSRA